MSEYTEQDAGDRIDEAYEKVRANQFSVLRHPPVTAERFSRIPDWYWRQYPAQRAKVLLGDAELLEYIEERIEDWRTDPLP